MPTSYHTVTAHSRGETFYVGYTVEFPTMRMRLHLHDTPQPLRARDARKVAQIAEKDDTLHNVTIHDGEAW
jgi:hypothetical protein